MLTAHPRSYFTWPLLTAASIPTICTATVTWPGWPSGSGRGPPWACSPSAPRPLSSGASTWPRCRSTNSAAQVRVCVHSSVCTPPPVPRVCAGSPPLPLGKPGASFFSQALSCIFTFHELASRFPRQSKKLPPISRTPSPSRIIVALNSLFSGEQTENACACGCGAERF